MYTVSAFFLRILIILHVLRSATVPFFANILSGHLHINEHMLIL
jgi:hypothetical protein